MKVYKIKNVDVLDDAERDIEWPRLQMFQYLLTDIHCVGHSVYEFNLSSPLRHNRRVS